MLLTDLRRDYLQTKPMNMTADHAGAMQQTYAEMIEQAHLDYAQDGVATDSIAFERYADMRYQGQEHTVKVAVSEQDGAGWDVDEAIARFHDAHEKRFTYRLDAGVQVVNFHLVAQAEVPKPDFAKRKAKGLPLKNAVLHKEARGFRPARRP